jgi:hypothetical protein
MLKWVYVESKERKEWSVMLDQTLRRKGGAYLDDVCQSIMRQRS